MAQSNLISRNRGFEGVACFHGLRPRGSDPTVPPARFYFSRLHNYEVELGIAVSWWR